jgi:hypothetical protein
MLSYGTRMVPERTATREGGQRWPPPRCPQGHGARVAGSQPVVAGDWHGASTHARGGLLAYPMTR